MSYEFSPDAEEYAAEPPVRSSRPRKGLWIAVGVLLFLLLLFLTPPLVHVNRYSRQIAQTMSDSLGRPVHLDSVTLGLLPVPHITLQNVVVSEDPAFGNEPIIRANVVEANLRASSLWRRPMEFSRVRFVEPSVNLVRNGEGRWNLEGVLVRAAQVQTAPTAQAHVGSTPRFPYIEATGGRVNIKLGDEKKPFSLVDTDFALWLPSARQWRVRLNGTPARTDTNLNDPGIFRLEGSFDRADHMAQVPVSLRASWHNAPLGEATRLITGEDQGWRGSVQIDASLEGRLGAGRLETDVTLDDLRRTDFVPVRTLSLHLHCAALADAPKATLGNAACSVPAGGPQPVRFQAEAMDLTKPLAGSFTAEAEQLPMEWIASWGRLFSARFPATPALPGFLDATLRRTVPGEFPDTPSGVVPHVLNGWTGDLTVHLPSPKGASSTHASDAPEPPSPSPAPPSTQAVKAEVEANALEGARLTLAPTPVRLAPATVLTLSGSATRTGYVLHATGQADPMILLTTARKLPPLGDGLPAALGLSTDANGVAASPAAAGFAPPTIAKPAIHVDITCSRTWRGAEGDQRCIRAPEPPRRTPAKSRP